MVVAMTGIAVNDAIIKQLMDTISISQLLFLRGVCVVLLLFFLIEKLFFHIYQKKHLLHPY